jgi:hypothetical protein
MNWWLPFKKLIIVSVLSGAMAAIASALAHVGDMQLPAWAVPVAQAALTGLSVAVWNILKHWNDPVGGPTQ